MHYLCANLRKTARLQPLIKGFLTMAKEIKSKVSYFQSNITSIVSVALVLLLIGVVAFTGFIGRSITNQIKENFGFNIILKQDATPEQIAQLDNYWKTAPFVSSAKYTSKEEALAQWQKDTGENLLETFGVNPLSAEYLVNVKSDYSTSDSLKVIKQKIQKIECVEEVVIHEAQIDTVNNNIRNISIALLSVAALLILISFVLINNTVRLTIYSRRFLIHTMKLVGAKPAFIYKPFVIQNIFNGLIAASIAIAIFFGLFALASNLFDNLIANAISTTETILVYCGLLVIGAAICGLAALLASIKYIRLSYDDLFKR